MAALVATSGLVTIASFVLVVRGRCSTASCPPQRLLLDEATTAFQARTLTDADTRVALYERAIEWNPDSFWAYAGRWWALDAAGATDRTLADAAREITHRFPFANAWPYVAWRDAAVRAGDGEEALLATRAGLAAYGHRVDALGAGPD